MSITQSMLDLALQYAGELRISAINLQLGELAAVVPESVELYFEYLSKGTLAEGARLVWERVPMRLTCQVCGRDADLEQWAGERPQYILAHALERGCECGSKDLRVTDGTGFGIVSLEVEG